MNIIWTIIILFSFVFAISTGNLNNLINSIFNVPKESLSLLVSIGSLIVIYNLSVLLIFSFFNQSSKENKSSIF